MLRKLSLGPWPLERARTDCHEHNSSKGTFEKLGCRACSRSHPWSLGRFGRSSSKLGFEDKSFWQAGAFFALRPTTYLGFRNIHPRSSASISTQANTLLTGGQQCQSCCAIIITSLYCTEYLTRPTSQNSNKHGVHSTVLLCEKKVEQQKVRSVYHKGPTGGNVHTIPCLANPRRCSRPGVLQTRKPHVGSW